MTDHSIDTTRLAEIRARLDAATDGPWEATPNGRILGQPRPEHAYERDVAETLLTVDADMIAHAPSDLAYLLSLAEQLQDQLDALEPIAAPRRESRTQRERNWLHGAWQSFDARAKPARAAANRWAREADRLEGWAAKRKTETENGSWPYENCCEEPSDV